MSLRGFSRHSLLHGHYDIIAITLYADSTFAIDCCHYVAIAFAITPIRCDTLYVIFVDALRRSLPLSLSPCHFGR